ncbi:hypothetical protein RJ641_002020, partial [Dillenia turbinata]
GRIPNGPEIAVKRLSQNWGQGELEFKNEVMSVGKLQQLTRESGQGRLHIFEYVPNTSLDNFIFGKIYTVLYDPMKREHKNQETRYMIIWGIVR